MATETTTVLDVVTALSTAGAAIFAAYSAWLSRQSVRVTRESLEDARLARKAELAPRMVLERDFLDFHFVWPHPGSLNGEPVFLARRHWKDADPQPPTFTLANFGQSPALELSIEWELQDEDLPLSLPDQIGALGIGLGRIPASNEGGFFTTLEFRTPTGSGAGIPAYRKWTTDIASCSPGQQRKVEFPSHILTRLFLRGLQNGSTFGNQLTLEARITCHAIDGARYTCRFRWQAMPFYHFETSPVRVYGHFQELPIHSKLEGPRVA